MPTSTWTPLGKKNKKSSEKVKNSLMPTSTPTDNPVFCNSAGDSVST